MYKVTAKITPLRLTRRNWGLSEQCTLGKPQKNVLRLVDSLLRGGVEGVVH